MREIADPDIARHSARFFRTGPGEYGEGDRFLGVRVPDVRRIAARFAGLPLAEIEALLRSPDHEDRLLALLVLVRRFEKGDARERTDVYRCYMRSLEHVDNWDLVDLSAPDIAGEYHRGRSRRRLHALARSRALWHRRIAIVATLAWIRTGDFGDTIAIAATLLRDPEDLIHKAAGWMLREVGKRDVAVLRAFLRRHASVMPRTMLRYAIEKFPEAERQRWLRGGGSSSAASNRS
ncbi:MAG: DNA alkylation repair protein [Gemmatimonadetes bacterium]|nr:DNA alkylation repair protein [Gemmatimonadota bacterium]